MANEYILENEKESQRLERQGKLNNYLPEVELQSISFEPQERVLDAGCGDGLLSRFLADNHELEEVVAIDSSKQRIEQAKEKSYSYQNIKYIPVGIEEYQNQGAVFNKIFFRYVLQHLSDPLGAIKCGKELLGPHGQMMAIDADGFIFDLSTGHKRLNHYLDKIRKEIPVDLYVGRKIPQLFHQAGLKSIHWELQPMAFQGDDLSAEIEMQVERFDAIKDTLENLLGSKEDVSEFIDIYVKEAKKEYNVLFYNKFIVTGHTDSRLDLV